MKKLMKCMIAFLMTLTILPVMTGGEWRVSAEENQYPMACNAYEVALVNGEGGFDKQNCYNSFEDAKNAMAGLGKDAVVRHGSSLSPSKIIAMNEGIAYSYPLRDASPTLSLNQHGGTKTSYMYKYREIHYISTDKYNGNGTGTIHGNVTGFDADIELKNVDLIPSRYVKENLSIYLGGNDASSEHEAPYLTKVRQSYYTVEQNGNYKELVFHAFSGWALNGAVPKSVFNAAVGPAADWMKAGQTLYSYNDYDFYYDSAYTQYAGTYYNYYQFAPLRTKSTIPADAYNKFLSSKGYGENSVLWNQGQTFINAQNQYGMNALMIFAQAVVESGYGTSDYAVHRNNLFGWNAVDSDPDRASYFDSVEDCVEQQMALNLRGYAYTDDYRFFGSHFGNKGSGITVKYASSSYYGLTLSSIVYEMDKCYNSADGNLTEYNGKQIGVVNKYAAPICITPNGSVLYTTEYGATYQMNHTVTILDESDGWYKIQSTNYIENGQSVNLNTNKGIRDYNWDTNVGWIAKSNVDIIGGYASSEEPEENNLSVIGTATVNVSQLRIRKGPGTFYSANGFVEDGKTYNVYEKTTGEGYTWYRIGEEQWVAGKGNWITFTPAGNKPAPQPEPEPQPEPAPQPEKPNPEPSPEEKPEESRPETPGAVVDSFVNDLKFDDNTHELHIKGTAFIEGIDAPKNSDTIKHQIVITDMNSGKEKVVEANTSNADTPVDIFDGHDYTAVDYSSDFDVDELPYGSHYVISVRVTNGGKTASRNLYLNYFLNKTYMDTDADGLVRAYSDSFFSNRVEIAKEKEDFDRTTIHKPTGRYSSRSVNSLQFENDKLVLDGFAYINGTSMTKNDKPSYSIMLTNEDGKSYTTKATNSKSESDYSFILGLDYALDYADYRAEINLADLPEGQYRMYIDIKNKDYEDIEELYSVDTKVAPVTIHNKRYSVSVSPVHNRLELTVTNK